MKIYTKKGDRGETSLLGGVRVAKDDLRIRTYGTFDELNAVLGMAVAEEALSEELRVRLIRIQGELFELGTELATPRGKEARVAVNDAEVEALEREIDAMEAKLVPLTQFILPGGSRLSGFLHLARTVCRRAERELTSLHRAEPHRETVLEYVNRLGDYLFVCARYANHQMGVKDVLWSPSARFS